jgi:hypothetical protein
MTVRRAVLAGAWYPDTERACQRAIEAMTGSAPPRAGRAGIVPHAGWDYSGALACAVLRSLAAADPTPDLVVLFGTHMAPGTAPHIALVDAFETPLGLVDAAADLARDLARDLSLRGDPADSPRSRGDNTVEVQLPLIKHFLPGAKLLVVGPPFGHEAVEIGGSVTRRAIETGSVVAVVGSTDLTHYGRRFGFAPAGSAAEAVRWVEEVNDARVVARMLEMDAEGVIDEAREQHNACVPGAAAAAIAGARELGLVRADLLRHATSWDVQPGGDSFVGYAAILYA